MVQESIQNVYTLNNITGTGEKKGILSHSRRDTVSTLFIEDGTPDSAEK